MDGMKPGAGSDPFDDNNDSGEAGEAEVEPDESASTPTASTLPWIYARESAKDDREMVPFFLQKETQRLESRAQTDLEEMLDDDVLLLDVREAAYQVVLDQCLDDVAGKLREWGYDVD